jgi:hypothetical protein
LQSGQIIIPNGGGVSMWPLRIMAIVDLWHIREQASTGRWAGPGAHGRRAAGAPPCGPALPLLLID